MLVGWGKVLSHTHKKPKYIFNNHIRLRIWLRLGVPPARTEYRVTILGIGIILIIAGTLAAGSVREYGGTSNPLLPFGLNMIFAGAVILLLDYFNRRAFALSEPKSSTAQRASWTAVEQSTQRGCYCWNCGTSNSSGRDSCRKCGKKLLHE